MEALIYFWKNIISEYIFDKQPLTHFEIEIKKYLSYSRLNPKNGVAYKKTRVFDKGLDTKTSLL